MWSKQPNLEVVDKNKFDWAEGRTENENLREGIYPNSFSYDAC
jgi:hypothetical protein